MSKILITGGAGFIGSHLSDHLIKLGHSVTAIDNLSTGSLDNLVSARSNSSFKFIEGDVTDIQTLEPLIAECDMIFHLAAVVGVRKVMENTVQTIKSNLRGTEAVLDAAVKYNKRIIITSTSEVYGANPNDTFHEEDDSIIGNSRHRRWCYAACKLLDEFLGYACHYSYDLPVTVVRLFNTIGPRQVGHYGMVVPNFIHSALAGKDIVVHGDGKQKRCFTSVYDVVDSLERLAFSEDSYGETFNIGSDNELSIIELAEMIKELTGSSSKITFTSYKEVYGEGFVDMQRRKPDLSNLKRVIGVTPSTPLVETLNGIIESFK